MARGAPEGRIWPLAAYDARIIEFDDDIDTIIAASRSLAGRDGCYVASTTRWCNPCQAEASKTIAYEIVEQLGDAPEWMIVPVGGGGTLAAIWRGFTELVEFGMVGRLPQMVAVVPKDYDAISRALAAGVTTQAEFDALPGLAEVPTLLTKLAHVHPPDGIEALAALRESGGLAVAVDDAQAVEGTMRAARSDGLFLEPSSGVVVAALDQLVSGDVVVPGSIVVALGCGSGFRETAALQLLNPTRREHGSLDRLSSSISGGEH